MIKRKRHRLFLLILLLGSGLRLWGINQPWKTHDHYNFGGPKLTLMTRCMQQTPWKDFKGIPLDRCDGGLVFYPNHPPTTFYLLMAATSAFGDHEWVYRSCTLVFSILNIYLVYLIGLLLWPSGNRALWASLFQSLFLGTLYFSTHVDVLSEWTVSFMLSSAYFALSNRWWRAMAFGIGAGIHSWMGSMIFAPLFLIAWRRKGGLFAVTIGGFLCFSISLALMIHMQQSGSLIEFLRLKLLAPGYVKAPSSSFFERILFLLNYVKVFISSQSRLLSPLFATWGFFELTRRGVRKPIYTEALLLTGLPCLIIAIVGYQYVMVHVFWYILWMPAFSLLCAQFIDNHEKENGEYGSKRVLAVLGLTFTALYPYGIFKTGVVHDALNSVVFVAASLVFLKKPEFFTAKRLLALVIIVGLANFSQEVNYRNEPATDYEFCQRAREEFLRTGKHLIFPEVPGLSRQLYCSDIPH